MGQSDEIYNKFVNKDKKKSYAAQKEKMNKKSIDLFKKMIYNFFNDSKGAVGWRSSQCLFDILTTNFEEWGVTDYAECT